jgi:hypothetical protein
VLSHIVPDALPKEFDDGLGPVLFKNTRPSKLQKLQIWFCCEQWRNIEFILRVKSAVLLGNRLAQQAVSANHFTIVNAELPAFTPGRPVDNNQMIAKFIKAIRIPARLG